MTAKCFVDTNIFVYARDSGAGKKQKLARELIEKLWNEGRLVISQQVVTELCAVLSSKFGVSDGTIKEEVESLQFLSPLPIDEQVIQNGMILRRHYNLSYWDSWIVAASTVAGCVYLLSEDLSHGAKYQDTRVIDPFTKDFDLVDLS